MEVIIVKDYEEVSQKAFEIFKQQIIAKPDSVLGLATGSSPIGLYKKLVAEKLDWFQIKTFNLDEYVGIAKTHKMSYFSFMYQNLFNYVDISKENINIPDGLKTDLVVVQKYDQLIKEAGGIDLQILGIGENGHIGFNEPGSDKDGLTKIVELTDSTISANSRLFSSKDQVPKKAISMGIGTIMKSRKIILIASGKNKALAIMKTIKEKPTSNLPASWLQLHEDTIIIIDQQAASLL